VNPFVFAVMPFLLTLYTSSINAADTFKPFVGTWEYRQANTGTASSFDEEGERLELSIENGQLKGAYFGLAREGEHGLFYTAVEISDIQVSNEKLIRFSVPERLLYSEQPKNLKDASRIKSTGFTRTELKMNGMLKKGRLILNCTSNNYECPAPVLEFCKGQ
jgi:hypothetical protein